MLYKYETHCHSRFCSRCAHSSPQELVYAYHRAGFAGLVLTDHFIHGNTCVPSDLPWDDRIQHYYDAYLAAKEAAEPLDFDVLFGIEHAYGNGLEALCYGIDLPFLLENPDIPSLSIGAFSERVHAYGGLLIQAHPYRYGGWEIQLPMEHLDGIEVCNAGNSPEKNRMAMELAEGTDWIRTAGSDLHHIGEAKLGTTGIALPYRVRTGQELVTALKNKEHTLILPHPH